MFEFGTITRTLHELEVLLKLVVMNPQERLSEFALSQPWHR
jgi:hypothetical protein